MLDRERQLEDTQARMTTLLGRVDSLAESTSRGPAVRLDDLRRLAEAIVTVWQSWLEDFGGDVLDLRLRPCHGDLKISNLRFDSQGLGVCLLDLDTLGRRSLSREMGDAWRSWCNPAGEDDPASSRLDVELFTASARGWLAQTARLDLGERELLSLVPGIERIALELAARFAADTDGSYFREDRARFPRPGAHNLERARGQLRLAHSARKQRDRCQEIFDRLRRGAL